MKVPLLSSTAFLYILFFSCELDSRMACSMAVRWSMTRTSNNASTCGCQTPLIPRSSLSPGSLEVAVASFILYNLGPHLTGKITNAVALWRSITSPPFLQCRACWRVKLAPQPLHLAGRLDGCRK